jgi:hypothetical protein
MAWVLLPSASSPRTQPVVLLLAVCQLFHSAAS